jgi:hypothetical protein
LHCWWCVGYKPAAASSTPFQSSLHKF